MKNPATPWLVPSAIILDQTERVHIEIKKREKHREYLEPLPPCLLGVLVFFFFLIAYTSEIISTMSLLLCLSWQSVPVFAQL